MLLAVEGGGFFSASASGYSKFVSLLLFRRKNEEKPMRVSPWSQYHLVEQEVDTQLASKKKRITSAGCAIFICFGHSSTCHDGNSPPIVDSALQSDLASNSSFISERKVNIACDATEENGRKLHIRSSIKKAPLVCSMVMANGDATKQPEEVETIVPKNSSEKKVHWTDTCGRELVEIREFEPSDDGPSDEELEHHCLRKCLCVIQ